MRTVTISFTGDIEVFAAKLLEPQSRFNLIIEGKLTELAIQTLAGFISGVDTDHIPAHISFNPPLTSPIIHGLCAQRYIDMEGILLPSEQAPLAEPAEPRRVGIRLG
jgi:hypothetical protein